jgi:hypothetical protein
VHRLSWECFWHACRKMHGYFQRPIMIANPDNVVVLTKAAIAIALHNYNSYILLHHLCILPSWFCWHWRYIPCIICNGTMHHAFFIRCECEGWNLKLFQQFCQLRVQAGKATNIHTVTVKPSSAIWQACL